MAKSSENDSENPVVKAFHRCRDALIRSIVKMSVRPEDVDDILHETFIKTYTANSKRQIRSPEDYLFVVSRNLVYRSSRRRSREISTVIDDALMEIPDSNLDMEIHEQLKCEAMVDVLASLPDNKRQAILLRKVYGFSSTEIAKKLSVSKSSVDKYIAGGIKECESRLNSRGYRFGQPGEAENRLGKALRKDRS
ncbi:RNA polymerase sigma factor [Porticoccus sp. GXU_MW_L64]